MGSGFLHGSPVPSRICSLFLALESILTFFKDSMTSSALLSSGVDSSLSYKSFQVLVYLAFPTILGAALGRLSALPSSVQV